MMKAELFILVTEWARNNLIQRILTIPLDGKVQVKLSNTGSKRSLAQNALYWVWLHDLSIKFRESGLTAYTDKELHEGFKSMFLKTEVREIMGEIIQLTKTTTKLGVKDFTQYLENIELYVGSEYGFKLPIPLDLLDALKR